MDSQAIWHALPVCTHAIAYKSYAPTPTSSSAVPLCAGDELLLVEQSAPTDPVWYRGYVVARGPVLAKSAVVLPGNLDPRVAVGIVPADCVASTDPPRHGRPIVAEITAALSEWCPTHMHELMHSQTPNTKLATLSTLIADLALLRRSLLADTSSDNAGAVKSAVWALVRGNKLVSGDIIVRDEVTGAVRTGRDKHNDDLVQFFRDQQIMALAPSARQATATATAAAAATHATQSESATAKDLLHLKMRVSGFGGTDDANMFARFYICDKTRVISEAVRVDAGSSETTTTALFVDLPAAVARDYVFMVVEVYETGYVTTQTRPALPVTQGPIPPGLRAAFTVPDVTPPLQPQTYTIQGRCGVAVGIVDVGRVLRERAETERTMAIRVFAPKLVDGTASNGGWGTMRTRLAEGSADGIQQSPKLEKIHVAFRAFASPSSEILLTTAAPWQFGDLVACPRTLLTTSSTVARDELYLTLGGVGFASQILRPSSLYYLVLSSPASIMFRDADRQQPSATWTSCVVSRDEKVGECVCMSPLVRGAVVFITVYSGHGRVIGRAVFPLWVEDVIAKDGSRTLPVTNAQGVQVGALDLVSMLVSTELSADETLLGLNRWRSAVNSAKGQASLLNALKQIDFVDEDELVKLLQEVLDSLFGILAWKKGEVVFEDSVFAALVHVVDVVTEKGADVKSMLDDYITRRFNYPVVLAPLLYGYQRLLSSHIDPEVGAYVRSLLKVGKYILRFIAAAWNIYQSQESVSIELGTFPKLLRHLFQQLCRIVEQDAADCADPETAATIVAHQALVLDHFAGYLAELKSFFTDSQLLELAVDFIESSAFGCSSNPQLVMHGLVLLQSFSTLWLFSSSSAEARNELASQTISWIKPYFDAPTDADSATPATWQAWKEKIRMCCSVLALQFRVLWPIRESCADVCGLYVRLLPDIAATFVLLQHELKNPVLRAGATPKFKHEFSVLFPEKFPFPPMRPVDTSAKKTPFDELSIELILLLAVLSEFATYEGGTSNTGKGETLTEQQAVTLMSNVLRCCEAVITGDAFPANWLSVYMFLHRSILSCLDFVSLVLQEYFVPQNDGASENDQVFQIWHMFFRTLIRLVGSPELEVESFAEQKRRPVGAIAVNVRECGARLLSKMWDAIGDEVSAQQTPDGLRRVGGLQNRFVTHKWCDGFALVGMIVELWGSRHEVLRTQAASVLSSMIVCEWNARNGLHDIQSDIIDALDHMFQTKASLMMTDSFSKSAFVDTLFELFPVTTKDPLSIEVHKMLKTVSRLVDLLIDLHGLPDSDAYNDDRILCTLNLMQFLKDLNREDTFVLYVHQLIHMQELSGHYAEAGLTLGLHAAIYGWRPDVHLPALAEPELPAQTSFERRETLSLQMVKYFALGNAPELAIAVYKELAVAYESISFDLGKLSTVSASIAKIYQEQLSASGAARPQPQFFKVSYQGLGFHRALRGKQFIVQGSQWEKLSEFTDRLHNLYPHATVVTTATPAIISTNNKHASTASTVSTTSTTSSSTIFDTETANAEGQFLQITAVSPEPSDALVGAVGIAPNERDFFLRSDLRRFSISRPVKSAANTARASYNPADVWVEKTVFTSKEPFPTILRRSVIQSSKITLVSPLASAADAVIRKTSEILQIARRTLSHNDESNSAQLSMILSGAVDAPVNGGVQQYRALLAIYATDADSLDQKTRLDSAIVDYAAVLKYALLVHARTVSSALRPLHDSLVVLFERNFKTELRLLESKGRVIDGVDIIAGARAGRASEDAKSASLSPLTPQTTAISATSSQHQPESVGTATLARNSTSNSIALSTASPPPAAAVTSASSPVPSKHVSKPSTTTLAVDRNASMSNISVSVTNSSQRESVKSSSSQKAPSIMGGQNKGIASRMGRRISKIKLGSTKPNRSVTSLGSFEE
ncbi:hypothetical protein V1517DRAFT_316694 [Lipomyces orientalis]|uniref:Uncharacterized protein n=1 Tax=Lipomyces orientalis TaxID=1233043 RepID=A0ACC3TVC1_9ASCO